MDSYAFAYCNNLKSINIPTTLSYIGDGAFYNSANIERVDIVDLTSWCNIEFDSYSSNPVSSNT
jgi:hypothetical protein